MELQDKLLQDLQQAMRTHEVARRNTLRLMRAALFNAEIDVGRPLSEAEELEILKREAKRRREAIEEYTPLGRLDKVEEAKTELVIIETYLPRQMERSEIETLARQVIAEVKASESSQVGEVMRLLMPRLRDKADGRIVNQIVRGLLLE